MKKIITPKYNGDFVTFPDLCFYCNPCHHRHAACGVHITCDERNVLDGFTGFKPLDPKHLGLLHRLLHKATGGSHTWMEEDGSVYVHPDDVSTFVSLLMEAGVTQMYTGRNRHLAHI